MGYDRQKVISIAKSEVGYLEKKNGDLTYLYDKTSNAGDKNYTKYGYEMHKLYPEKMDYPAYWCDSFVDWCFMQAYGVANARSLLSGDFDDYTVASAQLYKNKGAWKPAGTIPEPGWQIFFKNSSRICHTGLVVEYSPVTKKVVTIEGNTSSAVGVVANGGCVREKSYSIDDQSISGYGVPAYGNSFEFTPHWVKSNGKWYYRVSDCQNAHGWLLLNKKWYYLNESGEMLTGPQTIKSEVYGEELYYFMESGEEEGALCSTDERGSLHIWIDDK